jgi:hypothetical protein
MEICIRNQFSRQFEGLHCDGQQEAYHLDLVASYLSCDDSGTKADLINMLLKYSPTQILTCLSDRFRVCASSHLFCLVTYELVTNSCSSSKVWCFVYGFRFFREADIE